MKNNTVRRTSRQVRLIHWNARDGEVIAASLRAAGWDVDASPFTGPDSLRALREDPPDAVVIDLSRRPSLGRDAGVALRFYQTTRHVPVLLSGVDPSKAARIHELLPGAVFVEREEVASVVQTVVDHPPAISSVPQSLLAGYSNTPLVTRLGIRAGMVVCLIGAPTGFEGRLEGLPADVHLQREACLSPQLILWFVTSRIDLETRLVELAQLSNGTVWILWPKKSSGFSTDLDEKTVRAIGLSNGLVDYKVCAVDDFWSGLRFARRKVTPLHTL